MEYSFHDFLADLLSALLPTPVLFALVVIVVVVIVWFASGDFGDG